VSRRCVALFTVVSALTAALALPAGAAAFQLAVPQAANTKPEGFQLSGRQAIRIAARAPKVREVAREKGALRALTAVPLGTTTWQVGFYRGKTEVARALIDGITGRRIGPVYTGAEVLWPSARAVRTTFSDRLSVATLVLCVLFLLPFIDPRRPFRMLHLDLLALLAFEVSFLLLEFHHLEPSVATQYVPLVYLLGRLLWVGLRGGDAREAAVPFASDRLLAIGLVALVVARLAFNVILGVVGDVGFAGLFGADSLHHGWALYGNSLNGASAHLDSYGPVNYLFYLPFEAVFPLGPGWSHGNAAGAHLATITLDIAVILLLMSLGRKMLPGASGRRLGLTLGYAWAAYPFAFVPLALSANDEMVAVAVLAALLVYASPIGRGAVLGLGAAAKFAPLGLIPLFAGGRERSLRNAITCSVVAVGIFVLAFAPYVHQTSFNSVWESTIGFQMNRGSPFTLWGLHPSLEWLHVLAQIVAVAVAIGVGYVPRDRNPLRIAALAGAVVIAVQMAGTYWAHTYVAWFAAPAFVGLLGRYAWEAAEPGHRPRRAASPRITSARSSSGPRRRSPG
jgi:hypothetical protein